ncbi:response regulator [Candidatus Woesearchaeota archaeon]|nr:response regulator [Candidatus Woesearchaeota archaeon]
MTKATILIVEDESIVAKDIQRTVEGLGYSVVGVVATGKDAIEKAREKKPDLVLMDIMLKGGIDGTEAASEISKFADSAIIFLTAYSDEKKLQLAKASDIFGYLVKPFDENQLRISLDIALYKLRKEKELEFQKRRYEDLFNNAPDGYLSLDTENRVTDVNNTFLDLSGYSREEVIGSSIEIFFGDNSLLLLNGPAPYIEVGMRKKDNITIPVSVNSVSILDGGVRMGSRLAIMDLSEFKKLEKEKAMLAKEVIKLTKKIPLTENERIVMYSLVRYPLLNDIELSRKLKLKRSTITAIRNKLYREKFYFTYRLPVFRMIGCELAAIIYAKMDPLKENEAVTILDDLSKSPEQVYLDATNNELACVCVSRNITEMKMHIDRFISRCEGTGIARNFRVSYFPFETSMFERIFDSSSYLKSIFELVIDDPGNGEKIKEKRNLTFNEKIILYALVRFPSFNDSEIAGITKIPRPSISQARTRLFADGFLEVVNVPNFLKLGSELIELEHIVLDYDAPADLMGDVIGHLKESVNCCSIIASSNELFSLNVFSDYTEYESATNRNVRFYDEHKLKVVATSLHPILGVKVFRMNFSALISKIFGLSVDF